MFNRLSLLFVLVVLFSGSCSEDRQKRIVVYLQLIITGMDLDVVVWCLDIVPLMLLDQGMTH